MGKWWQWVFYFMKMVWGLGYGDTALTVINSAWVEGGKWEMGTGEGECCLSFPWCWIRLFLSSAICCSLSALVTALHPGHLAGWAPTGQIKHFSIIAHSLWHLTGSWQRLHVWALTMQIQAAIQNTENHKYTVIERSLLQKYEIYYFFNCCNWREEGFAFWVCLLVLSPRLRILQNRGLETCLPSRGKLADSFFFFHQQSAKQWKSEGVEGGSIQTASIHE